MWSLFVIIRLECRTSSPALWRSVGQLMYPYRAFSTASVMIFILQFLRLFKGVLFLSRVSPFPAFPRHFEQKM